MCFDVNNYFTFTTCERASALQSENLKGCSFFTERIANVWKSLPANDDFSSLPRFIQSIVKSISHSFYTVMSHNHVLYNIDYIILFCVCIFPFYVCVWLFIFSIMYKVYVLHFIVQSRAMDSFWCLMWAWLSCSVWIDIAKLHCMYCVERNKRWVLCYDWCACLCLSVTLLWGACSPRM